MRIAFVWSMSGPDSWNDLSLKGGVGGSRAMMIMGARTFSRAGHKVTCYAPGNESKPQIHRVTWKSLPEWPYPVDKGYEFDTDVLVSIRRAGWGGSIPPVRALWANDQGCFDIEEAVENGECNLVITISEFQKWLFQKKFPTIPENLYMVSSAGVEYNDYSFPVEKDPYLCMYSSTPERGLRQLIRLWTPIQEAVPQAKLVITSGFELYGWDKERSKKYSEGLYGIASYLPNTTVLGPIPRPELVEWQKKASLLIYPTIYDEMCCITALEMHAAGCAIVTTDRGALSERVRDGVDGFLVLGNPGTSAYDDLFIERTIELLRDNEKCVSFGLAGREQAERFSYQNLAEQWLKRFEEILYA